MKLTVTMHAEDGSFWAEIDELPGCFASGHTLDEMLASLGEGIPFASEHRGWRGSRVELAITPTEIGGFANLAMNKNSSAASAPTGVISSRFGGSSS